MKLPETAATMASMEEEDYVAPAVMDSYNPHAIELTEANMKETINNLHGNQQLHVEVLYSQ